MDLKKIANQATDVVLQSLHTSMQGLSDQEAQRRQQEYWFNGLTNRAFSWIPILLQHCKLPFIYLLAVAALLGLLLAKYQEAGDDSYICCY